MVGDGNNIKEGTTMIDGLGQSIYEDGVEQTKIEIAKSLLEKNVDLQIIIACTGLPEQQVIELSK